MALDSILDEILHVQLVVAWAGEGSCEPQRLGWWKTDLHDPAGGGDLLHRLLPKTHAWASLESMREAAIRTDAKSRAQMPDSDRLRTLFFLGFELDERLNERLAHHKKSGVAPGEAFSVALDFDDEFSVDLVAAHLEESCAGAGYSVVPGGRRMKGELPEDPAQLVRSLAAALVPLNDKYPMPFYTVK